MMKRKWFNIFICCTISICCNAQVEGYKFYAALDSIKTSGFYNIVLSPEINAHLKTDYSDVRIVNRDDKWVPHILRAPINEFDDVDQKNELRFSVAENNKTNTVILIAASKSVLNNIVLLLKNTAAERYGKFSGSDDNKKWFVINDSILINPTVDDINIETDFRINFPKSNYLYYKLEIVNNNKDPFNIKNIINYSARVNFKPNEIQNPLVIISQKDSANSSYIKVTQQQAFHFDMLNLTTTGSKYFSRKVYLYVPNNELNSFLNMGKFVGSFTISNNNNLHFSFPIQESKEFYLLIDNEDNLPLKMIGVKTSINEHYLTTYLVEGQNYKLVLGNTDATLPNYDLQKTFPTVKDTLPFLGIRKLISFKESNIQTPTLGKNNKWIIWTVLIAGLFILLLLTKKMIKEVDKKTINDTI